VLQILFYFFIVKIKAGVTIGSERRRQCCILVILIIIYFALIALLRHTKEHTAHTHKIRK